jgi:putative salt-induced outer membrane protein
MKLVVRNSLLSVAVLLLPGVVAFAHDEAPAPAGPWKANAALNAIVNSGNSDSQTGGANAMVSWKEDANQVQWKATGAYGRTNIAGVDTTNTENFRTELRYDRFFNEVMSMFVLGHIGYDKPAGFDLRGGGALGFAHKLIVGPPHSLRYEVGPDYTHEERTDKSSDDIFSARGFVGYGYEFSKTVSFTQDVEALENLSETSDFRLNTLTALKAKMTDILSFQVGFNVRADFEPVPGFEEVDTTTTVGLIFDIL